MRVGIGAAGIRSGVLVFPGVRRCPLRGFGVGGQDRDGPGLGRRDRRLGGVLPGLERGRAGVVRRDLSAARVSDPVGGVSRLRGGLGRECRLRQRDVGGPVLVESSSVELVPATKLRRMLVVRGGAHRRPGVARANAEDRHPVVLRRCVDGTGRD